MPFTFSKVDERGAILTMWDPKVSGDYIADCKKGRDYADEVIVAMRQKENPALLGWVVRGFGQDEARRGVEAGFCQRIAEAVLSG